MVQISTTNIPFMIDSLRQLHNSRTEIAGKDIKFSVSHTQRYACLTGDKHEPKHLINSRLCLLKDLSLSHGLVLRRVSL